MTPLSEPESECTVLQMQVNFAAVIIKFYSYPFKILLKWRMHLPCKECQKVPPEPDSLIKPTLLSQKRLTDESR